MNERVCTLTARLQALRRHRPYLALVRVVLAVVLVVLVLTQVHWHDTVRETEGGARVTERGILWVLHHTQPGYVLAGVGILVVSVFTIAMRWRILLAAQGIALGVWRAYAITYMAEFASQLLPGRISGDALKVVYGRGRAARASQLLVSVVMDRIIGLLAVVGIGGAMVCGITLQRGAGVSRVGLWSIAALALLLGGALAALLNRRLHGLLARRLRRRRVPFQRFLNEVVTTLAAYRGKGRYLGFAGATSVVAQTLHIICILLLGRALALDIPWYQFFIFVPIITVISALPLTPGSIGVSESLYVYYFAPWGNAGELLLLSLLHRGVTISGFMPGGVCLACMKVP